MKYSQILCFSLLWFLPAMANAGALHNPYRINDEQVEATFAQSTAALSHQNQATFTQSTNRLLQQQGLAMSQIEDPDPTVATVLAFFLGYYGLHRVYLGSSVKMVFLYVFTCGGFGVLPFVDGVVLLMGTAQNDISQYINNDSFIMWL